MMNEITTLIDALKKAGIQPQVAIVVDAKTSDVQAIKTLQTALKNAGIVAQVQIQVHPESGTAEDPGSDTSGRTREERRTVRVKEPRLNCFTFRKVDKVGKPIMEIREPRVQLMNGATFFVSTTQKVSPNDSGDGIIRGTGNSEYYFVVDCPPNPSAVGLYVRKVDVENIS
jgi:hypothetical protein